MATRPWVVAALSAAVIVLVSCTVPLFVYSDQAFQLKATQQALAGESPLANAVAQADPADLTITTPTWITRWPPSTQLAVTPLARAGLSIGVAARTAAGVALLLGAIGWLRWWSAFALPRSWLLVVALLLPWEQSASSGVFQYSAEALAFGTIPWVLLAIHRVSRHSGEHPHFEVAFFAGLASGALYWVKYPASFTTAGGAAYLLLVGRRARPRLADALAFAAGAIVPVSILSIANHNLGGAENAFTSLLTNPPHAGLMSPVGVTALGVAAALTLAWLLATAAEPVERMAATIMLVTAVLALAAWVTLPASLEPRDLHGAAMTSLPAAVAIARRRWSTLTNIGRGWLVAVAIAFIGIPWAYGAVSVAEQFSRGRHYTTTATRLYNPIATDHDLPAAIAAFREACAEAPQPSVWYVPDPLTSLELSGPMVVTHADVDALDRLSSRVYRGATPICALLPPAFEANGKGPAIRASFADVSEWRRHPVRAANYDVWVGRPRGL